MRIYVIIISCYIPISKQEGKKEVRVITHIYRHIHNYHVNMASIYVLRRHIASGKTTKHMRNYKCCGSHNIKWSIHVTNGIHDGRQQFWNEGMG